jgi:hypothetical protein
MAKQKRRRLAAGILFGGSGIAATGIFLVLVFFPELPAENRARIILYACLAILGCFAGLVLLAQIQKREQIHKWRRIISILYDPARKAAISNPSSLPQIDPQEMEEFAVQLYRKLGYRLLQRDSSQEGDILFYMLNPDGQIELFLCIQRNEPASLGEVCALYETMSQCGAKRCALWSAWGYKTEAAFWARGKPILLADQEAVARMTNCVTEIVLNA